MKKNEKIIRVRPTCEYPCQWDDLIGPDKKVVATLYTIQEVEKDNLKLGVKKGKDGVYDIVVHAKEINNDVEAIMSLIKTIKTEIEELINGRP